MVLIYHQEKPAVYARIEGIGPDVKRGWYQVTFLFLTIPPQEVMWILREEYISGAPFTMGGKPMKLEKVPRVDLDKGSEKSRRDLKKTGEGKSAKVIPFRNNPGSKQPR